MSEVGDPRDALDARDVRPVVPLPRGGLTGTMIALMCVALGLILFLLLDANRRSLQDPEPKQAVLQGVIAAPPDLALPRPPVPDAPPPTTVQPVPVTSFVPPLAVPLSTIAGVQPSYAAPTAPPPPPVQQPAARTPGASMLLMDVGPGDAAVTNGQSSAAAEQSTAGDDQAVRATIIRNRASLVSQGTLIPAVLETPIDSTRAGMTRAVVTRDIRGFDGTRVLIPRGSRLIGEAGGDAKPGQKRVLVTWNRLIRPDGVAIRIGSPGADRLGGAGIRGNVNTHFIERFGNAVLQTAFAIGVNKASSSGNNSVVVALPGQVGSVVGQVPVFDVPQGPTISVKQGAEISIFVARDLDFGGVGAR